MLSEKQLERVQGGWVITLSGIVGFVGGVFGNVVAGVGAGTYEAHDSMGHYGHVTKAEAVVKPVAFSQSLELREEKVTILNSDDMRDLSGASISIGATASLPQKVQEWIGNKCGGAMGELFGIITSGSVGAEVTIPVINDNGRQESMFKITTTDPAHGVVTGNGLAKTGIELYAAASVNDVKIDKTDRMENMCYHCVKSTTGKP